MVYNLWALYLHPGTLPWAVVMTILYVRNHPLYRTYIFVIIILASVRCIIHSLPIIIINNCACVCPARLFLFLSPNASGRLIGSRKPVKRI